MPELPCLTGVKQVQMLKPLTQSVNWPYYTIANQYLTLFYLLNIPIVLRAWGNRLRQRRVSQRSRWTEEKDEDGGMRRDRLWHQEADPLLLLLLFYNELLKPSFPSLP